MHTVGLLLALVASIAYAYPKFSSPAPGASLPGGVAFTVSWVDSGAAPALADLSAYQLALYSGSNAAPVQLLAISNGAFSAGNTASITVPVTTGGTGTNAYFLGLISTATAGGTITTYSDRFTLTGMIGTFPATVITALATVPGTKGPDVVNNVAAAAAAATDESNWAIPYNQQTGLTRYAPMQPVPPTKITAVNTKPLWPTSSVPVATTLLPVPSQVTTLTQPQTYSVASHPNTAAAASQPTDDMQRFLNRWKD